MADDKPSISIKLDGKVHTVYVDDVTGLEHRDFRRAVGVGLDRLKLAIAAGAISMIEVAAGIAWLARRREGEQVAYEEVLGTITNGNYEVVEGEDGPPD